MGLIPWLSGRVTDAIATVDTASFQQNIIFLGCVGISSAIVYALTRFIFTYLARAIETDLKSEVFRRFLSQPFAFFDREKIGDLMCRLDNDTSRLSEPIGNEAQHILMGIISVIISIGMCYFTSSDLTIIALCVLFPMGLIQFWYSEWAFRIEKSSWGVQGQQYDVSREAFSMIRTVRLFQKEEKMSESFDKHSRVRLSLAKREAFGDSGTNFIEICLEHALRILILLYGGWKITSKSQPGFTIGSLVAFQLYFEALSYAFTSITESLDGVIRARASLDRVMLVFEQVPVLKPSGIVLESIGDIEFKDVSFRYEDREEFVLRNLNLKIERGTVVALVGKSGGGKSTICGLVSGLYDIEEGQICYGGIDGRDLDKRSLHSKLGVVMQDTEMFNQTIESNVSFGALGECTHEDVVAACKLANAHDFIMEFPDKYQTKVGERGLKLSGGQRQRLALARVLIRKPQLLILDETTSALDAESEAVVQQSIDQLLATRNITVVLVAHRLSTVINANKICVISEGKVVEEGNHAALLSQKGVYYKLVSRQVEKLANTLDVDSKTDEKEKLKQSKDTIDSLFEV